MRQIVPFLKQIPTVNGTSILRLHNMQARAESGTIRPSKRGGRRGEGERKTAPRSRARSSKVPSHSRRADMLCRKLSPTNIHAHTYKHATGNSINSPSFSHLRPLSPCRAADAVAREAQRQQHLAARREATRQRAAARRHLRREQQAAAAGALQQQVDE